MCGNSCYATCDDENPTCDDTCTPTCNCIDGFVKSSDDGECIPIEECKNVVDLTCGDNEELVNSYNEYVDHFNTEHAQLIESGELMRICDNTSPYAHNMFI